MAAYDYSNAGSSSFDDFSPLSPMTEEDYGDSSFYSPTSTATYDNAYSSPTYDTPSTYTYDTPGTYRDDHSTYDDEHGTYSNPHPSSSLGGGSHSHSSDNDGRLYVCLAPGCQHSPFKRVTDLDRHYKSVHVPDDDKEKYFCDYKKCPRNTEPFFRPERLRNHLRDYHKEDLPKKGTKISAEWLRERNVSQKWWRCYSCLTRVEVRKQAFVCPGCHQACEGDRQGLREGGGKGKR